MNRRTVTFTAPNRVELREEPLPGPGADDVLVETALSAISAGTEMLVYQGRFPRDLPADSAMEALRDPLAYPIAYGYACVGVVKEAGKGVGREWLGRTVFAFQPHTSHFVSRLEQLIPLPSSLTSENAVFLPNMETAVNLVQDAAPILGERALVLGQGVVGLLTTALLRGFPLQRLITADRYERRRGAALGIGVDMSLDPAASGFRAAAAGATPGFDLTFELSGSPAALDDAIALTAYSGRIVIGSWYGEKRAPVDLGGAFHRSRIKLIASQVSTIAPELSGRWDKRRRFDVAWSALERIKPAGWITHRFGLEQADEAYTLLADHAEETIQVVFDYG